MRAVTAIVLLVVLWSSTLVGFGYLASMTGQQENEIQELQAKVAQLEHEIQAERAANGVLVSENQRLKEELATHAAGAISLQGCTRPEEAPIGSQTAPQSAGRLAVYAGAVYTLVLAFHKWRRSSAA